MEYTNHLYALLYPTTALIGSQCAPEVLAKHFTVGPTRHYRGKIAFVEIDASFRAPYFAIDAAMAALTPHEDGRPKATKYIASYRVLEHIDFSALRSLYLVSEQGDCLELQQGPYTVERKPGEKIYAEITPLRMLVLSRLEFGEFGKFITDPKNSIGAPKFCYTQLEFEPDEFLAQYEANPFMQAPIENLHPSILRDAIQELRTVPNKNNKGLSLRSNLDSVSYKLVRGGFMFSSPKSNVFYPMPSLAEIERRSLRFWKSL